MFYRNRVNKNIPVNLFYFIGQVYPPPIIDLYPILYTCTLYYIMCILYIYDQIHVAVSWVTIDPSPLPMLPPTVIFANQVCHMLSDDRKSGSPKGQRTSETVALRKSFHHTLTRASLLTRDPHRKFLQGRGGGVFPMEASHFKKSHQTWKY